MHKVLIAITSISMTLCLVFAYLLYVRQEEGTTVGIASGGAGGDASLRQQERAAAGREVVPENGFANPGGARTKTPDSGEMQVNDYFRYADQLFSSKSYAAAAREYVACYKNGPKKGIVRAIARGRLAELAKLDPAAASIVAELRDAMKENVKPDRGSGEDAFEYAIMNKHLGDSADTIATYDQLDENDHRRTAMNLILFDEFVAQKRYTDALLGKPFSGMIREVARYSTANEQTRKETLPTILNNIEALTAANRRIELEKIQLQLLTIDDSPQMMAAIRSALERGVAGRPP